MTTLDGPRIEPRSGRAERLVILLHGYGASGDDLIELGRIWSRSLPATAFVSPHAPEHLPFDAMSGYQWFDLERRDEAERWTGVNRAAPVLNAFIDAELARHALPASRIALVGFSQGTMMALHVALRRAQPVACVVGYSGLLAGPQHLGTEIKCRPPVLLVHGDSDEVIPVAALHHAREALAAADVRVEWHSRPGLGHGIDAAGLSMAGAFLAAHLA